MGGLTAGPARQQWGGGGGATCHVGKTSYLCLDSGTWVATNSTRMLTAKRSKN